MIRKVERRDARSIARIYNRYVTETTISFETLPVDEAEMLRRIEDTASRYPYFVYEECGGKDIVMPMRGKNGRHTGVHGKRRCIYHRKNGEEASAGS